MKKKKKMVSKISLLLLVSMFACALMSCKNSDNMVGNMDVGNIDTGDISVENSPGKIEKTVDNEFAFSDIAALNKLVAQNKIGDITLKASEDSILKVKTETIITVYSKKDMEHIQNNIDVKKSTDKDSCTLSIVSKDSGSDLWKWLDKEVGKYNVSVGLTIEVPENFKDFKLNTECGSIQATGLEGTMDLKAEVGGVTVDQCQLKDKCAFETETGNVDLTLCEKLDYNASLDIEAGTGNVGIHLNKNSIDYTQKDTSSIKAFINEKYSVTVAVEVGTINMSE